MTFTDEKKFNFDDPDVTDIGKAFERKRNVFSVCQ